MDAFKVSIVEWEISLSIESCQTYSDIHLTVLRVDRDSRWNL